MNDRFNDYLQRPLLNATFKTDDELLIETNATLYIQLKKDVPTSEKEIKEKLKEVGRLAKEQGVTVRGKNKALAILKDNYEGYERSCNWCNNTIDNMIPLARKIAERGLHVGTNDDRELNNLICNAEMIEGHRSNVTSSRHRVESLISNIDYLISRLRVPYHSGEVFIC